jgi:hypothetical protein
MQNYINQLLGDFDQLMTSRQSYTETNPLIVIENDSNDDLLELSKLYITREQSFANLLGIQQDALPPEKKLSDKQITELLERIENTLVVYQCFLDFPTKIIDRKKYTIIRDHWNEPQDICNKSFNTIDFCDYDQEHCLYGEKSCQCRSFENEG